MKHENKKSLLFVIGETLHAINTGKTKNFTQSEIEYIKSLDTMQEININDINIMAICKKCGLYWLEFCADWYNAETITSVKNALYEMGA